MANTNNEDLIAKLDYLEGTKSLIKQALIDKGQTVTDDDTFRSYATKILELKGGDAIVFDTIDEMNNYKYAEEGQLALVYGYRIKKYTNDTITSKISFPEQVVLEEEITSSQYVPYRYYGDTYYCEGEAHLTPSAFNFFMYERDTELDYNNEFEVNYVSEDGITYIRAEEITNPVCFSRPLTPYAGREIPAAISEFMLIEGYEFDGLFEYSNGAFKVLLDNNYDVMLFTSIEDMNAEKNAKVGDIALIYNGSSLLGIYTYISSPNNTKGWEILNTQLNLISSNQLLTNRTAYGNKGIVTGDGSYIRNIPVREVTNQYFPTLTNDNSSVSVIQSGKSVPTLSFATYKQITIDDAYSGTINTNTSIVQRAYSTKYTLDVSSNSVVQNYLNSSYKISYDFLIDGVSHRLFFGYNYATTTQTNASGVTHTVPSKMTSLYAFILNLETLTIYKTFSNTDSWYFTSQNFGDVLSINYSISSDKLVILSNLYGWGYSNGAYIGLTTISTSGTRNTNYYTVNYSADYTYKSITYVTYDYENDCYYMTYKSFPTGGSGSIKRIVKLTSSGSLSSVFTTSENMTNIGTLWTSNLKDKCGLICYYTETDGMVLKSCRTLNSRKLYGSTFSGSNYIGFDGTYAYVSTKSSEDDTYYNIHKINVNTLTATVIPNTQTSSRKSSFFFNYNRKPHIFLNNNIIDLNGVIVGHFNKTNLNYIGTSGIDDINEEEYKTSFKDYSLSVNSSYITGYDYNFKYYRYDELTSFPVKEDLCFVISTISSSNTFAYNTPLYKSIPLSAMGETIKELNKELETAGNELASVEADVDDILGGEE